MFKYKYLSGEAVKGTEAQTVRKVYTIFQMGETWSSCTFVTHTRAHFHFSCLTGIANDLPLSWGLSRSEISRASVPVTLKDGHSPTCDIHEHLASFLPSFSPDSSLLFPNKHLSNTYVICVRWYNTGRSAGEKELYWGDWQGFCSNAVVRTSQ